MKYLLIALTIGLLVAHQDYWNWNDATLVWGWLPMGLFYHLCISLAAGLVWLVAVNFAWPKSFSDLDAEIVRKSQINGEADKSFVRANTSHSSGRAQALRFVPDRIYLTLRFFMHGIHRTARAVPLKKFSRRREVSP